MIHLFHYLDIYYIFPKQGTLSHKFFYANVIFLIRELVNESHFFNHNYITRDNNKNKDDSRTEPSKEQVS